MHRITSVALSIALVSPLATGSPAIQDVDLAKQFLYCASLNAYLAQETKDGKAGKRYEAMMDVHIYQASGLTQPSFSASEMPRALERFSADWKAANRAVSLEAFLRQKTDECAKLNKDHGERALRLFNERPKASGNPR